MQTDPYLASLEQRIALVKLHALALVALVDMVTASTLSRQHRESLLAELRQGIELVRRLAPAETVVLDDAIRRLRETDPGRARALESTRSDVRESLARVHTFMARPTPPRPWPWLSIVTLAIVAVATAVNLWALFG